MALVRRQAFGTVDRRPALAERLGLDCGPGLLGLLRGAVAAVFRQIPFEIKKLESLGVPDIVAEIAKPPRRDTTSRRSKVGQIGNAS